MNDKSKKINIKALNYNLNKDIFNVTFKSVIASATRPDVRYVLILDGWNSDMICQCEAHENGRNCWHKNRVQTELNILKEYMIRVVSLFNAMGWSEITEQKMYEYMKIVYVNYHPEKEVYHRHVIQLYRKFVYNHLFQKIR